MGTAHVRGSDYFVSAICFPNLGCIQHRVKWASSVLSRIQQPGRQDVKSYCNLKFLVCLSGKVLGIVLALSVGLIYPEFDLDLYLFSQ
jgi:hypothetical protein